MNKFKLTAFAAFIISILSLVVVSCEKPLDIDENVFTKYGIPMNGSQVVPANSSTATGTLDVLYVRGEHTLSYTINWSGLSGPPANITTPPQLAGPAIGVYGPADPFFMSPVAPLQTVTSGFTAATSGTYKGSLFVDNVLVKEVDLLNNKFYIMIKTAAYPAGQLRAQVDFR
jgi:hypothetical protein